LFFLFFGWLANILKQKIIFLAAFFN